MKNVYIINYSVKGIKTLDQLVSMSFYKKTIDNDMDTTKYNVKGIYGANGSGKSAIITSIEILKNLVTNPDYLNNPIVQNHLNEIINKKLGKLYMNIEYAIKLEEIVNIYSYEIELAKDNTGKYVISYECLTSKPKSKNSNNKHIHYEVKNGKLEKIEQIKNSISKSLEEKTINLLSTNTMSVLFMMKVYDGSIVVDSLVYSLLMLFVFGTKIHVYMDQSDEHREYLMNNFSGNNENQEYIKENIDKHIVNMESDNLYIINISDNNVPKKLYPLFEKKISNMYEFLHIFKPELKDIEIDRRDNKQFYICDLIMVYDSYKINAEFESTGIKKLIKLFAYIKEMANGGIVFIDEMDSNLHDVYLCALLEYLMEYGEGQLCFTTHNVGPMDILKKNKKSIDFLSSDHLIYQWVKNGNYSPSNLYKSGMIEGSPFNIDAIDFIGIL